MLGQYAISEAPIAASSSPIDIFIVYEVAEMLDESSSVIAPSILADLLEVAIPIDSSDSTVSVFVNTSEVESANDDSFANYNVFVNVIEDDSLLQSYEYEGDFINDSINEIESLADSHDARVGSFQDEIAIADDITSANYDVVITVVEPVTAIDIPNAINIVTMVTNEVATAIVNEDVIREVFGEYSAITNATDLFSVSLNANANINEFQSITDSYSLGNNIFSVSQSAITSAIDVYTSIILGNAIVNETATAKDRIRFIANGVSFNDPFNSVYDNYSVKISDITIPSYFVRHEVDTSIDSNCLAVFSVSPENGASKWSRNNRWITIGMYRDTGRKPSNSSYFSTSWVRTAANLTIIINDANRIQVGDFVEILNSNVSRIASAKVLSVTSNSFTVSTSDTGLLSGNCQYRYINYQFAERRVIFRLLPNNKIITIAELNELFNYCAPVITNTTPSIGTSKQFGRLTLGRRFDQIYDHFGEPLSVQYQNNGLPIIDQVVAGKSRQTAFNNSPVITESDDNDSVDSRIYVYDTYGIEINNPFRGPHFVDNIITRDTTITGNLNNILRKTDSRGQVIYDGPLFDAYGNPVVGINSNNTVVIKEAFLPITVDRFNRPVGKSFRI